MWMHEDLIESVFYVALGLVNPGPYCTKGSFLAIRQDEQMKIFMSAAWYATIPPTAVD